MTKKMFELTDEFKLNIESMDNEHQKLVDMLNHIYGLLNEGKREQARTYFTQALTEYINVHFANEEAMLASIGYPELGQHKSVHEGFKRSFARLVPRIENGDDAAFRLALADAFSWLISHIGKTDKRYEKHYFARKS